MAEEFQLGRGNWWESTSTSTISSSSRNNKVIDSGNSSCTTPSASSTTVLSSMGSNFVNWPSEIHEDIKVRSDNSSMVFLGTDSQKRYASESSVAGGGGGGGVGQGVLSVDDPNLQMMGLGLSSQGLDWNQPFLSEKSGSDFRSMLQEGLSSNVNYQQEGSCHEQDQNNWSTQKLYHGNSDDSSINDYNKQILNRGISLDHQSSTVFSGQNNLENSVPYGSPSNMLQGLLISDHNSQQQEANNFTSVSRSLYYNPSYNNPSNCDMNIPPTSIDVMSTSSSSSSWSKFPQFLRTSDPPKIQQWPLQPPLLPHGGTPFWSATSAAAADDVHSGFVPSLHPQLPTNPTVDEKPKHTGEVRNTSIITKKNSSETSNKRPRNEASSPSPAFKVRKEKMGDRITALQQLVSPFGKTDTASVLSEAIEYIKFLHEQVNVLSTPYMKSGASMQHQQSGDKSNVNQEERKQDLRSRGLCLVPVSSTFPVTHETTVDFWTPTFGGTFR